MDACESRRCSSPLKKHSIAETKRRPLINAGDKNGNREVSSRYRSPTPSPSTPSSPRRCPSPNPGRPSISSISSATKMSTTPSSPRSPRLSTPIKDTTAEKLVASRKIVGNNKVPESLWPSTMRSLSVSFQSDAFSLPITKREKPASRGLSDRTVNVVHKPANRPNTPLDSRKRSPLKGKNSSTDHPENFKPIDGLNRNASNKKADLTGKTNSVKNSLPLRRLSLDGVSSVKNQSSPTARSCPSSPPSSRVSPAQLKTVNPFSRGPSPARVRPSSPSKQGQSSPTSVLTFIVDIKRGKKASNQIEDVHELRLLYNRLLQWRYVNAKAYSVQHSQKTKAEKLMYNIWQATLDLRKSVTAKKIVLQQLRHKLKLYAIFSHQIVCLDEWACIERDHSNVLSWAIQDLQASTLRIPVTGGAKVDTEAIKAAVCSAVDVIRVIGLSIGSIFRQVERLNTAVFGLAEVAARERAMLDEFESLLTYTAAMQVEEHSLRTQLIQSRKA